MESVDRDSGFCQLRDRALQCWETVNMVCTNVSIASHTGAVHVTDKYWKVAGIQVGSPMSFNIVLISSSCWDKLHQAQGLIGNRANVVCNKLNNLELQSASRAESFSQLWMYKQTSVLVGTFWMALCICIYWYAMRTSRRKTAPLIPLTHTEYQLHQLTMLAIELWKLAASTEAVSMFAC